MSNKNPFEIRLEVMKMAKEMLETSYADGQSMAWDMVNQVAEYQGKNVNQMKEFYEAMRPAFPTTEEIIKQANELYSFVTDTKAGQKNEETDKETV